MVDHKDLIEPEDEDGQNGVDRRSFVKGALGAATLGAVGAAGFGIFKPMAVVKPTDVTRVNYIGAKVIAGSPAPRGLAVIPVRVNEDGFVEGVPEHLDWYRYCSHEQAPGLANPDFTDDNTFEYFLTEEKIVQAEAAGTDPKSIWWYADRLEEKVHVDHFRDQPLGSAAAVRWRSQDQAGDNIITAIVLKLDPDQFSHPDLESFMDTEHNLIAYISFCTHFCCVPGFKETRTAEKFDAWEKIFCTCHNSRFDPTDLTEYEFDLKLASDEEDGGH